MEYAKEIFHKLKTRQVLLVGLICAGGIVFSLLAFRIAFFRAFADEAPQKSNVYALPALMSGIGPDGQKLISGLTNAGFHPVLTGSLHREFFSVEGKIVALSGDNVQLFEYPDESTALKEVSIFAQDAETRGGAWKKRARLYVSGALVVFYMGERKSTLDALGSTVGSPEPLQEKFR